MPSFDIVSEIDKQEIDNALNQARKELATRFDFKGSVAGIEYKKDTITLTAEDASRLRGLREIVIGKLSKRGVDLRNIDQKEPAISSIGHARQELKIQQGLEGDKAKEIILAIKGGGFKVQNQLQDRQIRVTGKKRDELQEVIAFVKSKDFGVATNFKNFAISHPQGSVSEIEGSVAQPGRFSANCSSQNSHLVLRLALRSARDEGLAALHRRHDRDLVVRLNDVIACNEVEPRPDEKAAVPFLEFRKIAVKPCEQIRDRGAVRQIERDLARADDLFELGKKLNPHMALPRPIVRPDQARCACASLSFRRTPMQGRLRYRSM